MPSVSSLVISVIINNMKVTSKTLLCASFALSNRSSLAPAMHNAAFEKLALDFVYIALEPESIEEALRAVRALKIVGGSISTPYKEQAIQCVDEVDETAKTIGAINVFRNVDGKITGYNSDWIGAISALEEKTTLAGRNVALLGAGGAARAVLYGLIKRGAKVTLYNRTPEKGLRLAEEFEIAFGGEIERINEGDHEVIVNATSVGKDAFITLPIKSSAFRNTKVLMDISTAPEGTTLMKLAADSGIETVGGLRMLVLQGAFTFELITGHAAPVDVMFDAVESSSR